MKNIFASQENVIKVDTSWNSSNQGIVITFTIPVDCDEVNNIVSISNMLSQFVFSTFKDFFNKYDFWSKFNTPMVMSEQDNLRLYMCFVAKDTEDLRKQLKKLQIQERNYV